MSVSSGSRKAIVGSIEQGAEIICSGGVVAYPTESCFGLGCDPDNDAAIQRILNMKKRERSKGLILIADKFDRFTSYLEDLPDDIMQKMVDSWPGPNTWLCPVNEGVSEWLRGDYSTLAIRVTAHAPAKELSMNADRAIVSTSANVATKPALTTVNEVIETFGELVDLIVDHSIGHDLKPSTIRDAVTGEVLR
ncbi:MAG: Sua5/YciO/YrdC/YwlC family protein [Acidiferrobacterales bacterium]|nr:Sua5/YciO/YrdC/YwlC family protein [Acidiferrobacterales bacterium]